MVRYLLSHKGRVLAVYRKKGRALKYLKRTRLRGLTLEKAVVVRRKR